MRHLKSRILNSKSEGFTMIELLVAMSLFAVLMAVAAGSFVRSMRTQRAITALMAVNDNASLTLEQMSREIRTGYHFQKATGSFGSELDFVNADNEVISYRLNTNDGTIERGLENASLLTNYEKITADNVKVTRFNFILRGEVNPDGLQPRITIAMSVTDAAGTLGGLSTDIQTTISSRVLDE